MSAEAYHHHLDVHRLVERMDDAQASAIRAVALQIVRTEPADDVIDLGDDGDWPPPWFGSITTDETDIAARSGEILREEFGRS